MNNKREDYNLIYSKIGGCLRNEQSDYAIQVVHDLMENHAQYKTVKLIDNIKKLEQSNKQWIELAEERGQLIQKLETSINKLESHNSIINEAKDKEIEELKDDIEARNLVINSLDKELERLKKGFRDLAEGFRDKINEGTFNSIIKQTE
jgi:esterase/lipase